MTTAAISHGSSEPVSDAEIVERVLRGDVDAFASLMRRHNCRLFRAVRSVLRNDAEAEDTCQEAWLNAYTHLQQLDQPGAFSGWLLRIGLRCAFARRRRSRWIESLDDVDLLDTPSDAPEPGHDVARRELVELLEQAIDRLPPSYRLVVMLRDIEHMTTSQAADLLGIEEQNVRVRLHRARASLRAELSDLLGDAAQDVFRFDGNRCERLTAAVMPKIRAIAAASVRFAPSR